MMMGSSVLQHAQGVTRLNQFLRRNCVHDDKIGSIVCDQLSSIPRFVVGDNVVPILGRASTD